MRSVSLLYAAVKSAPPFYAVDSLSSSLSSWITEPLGFILRRELSPASLPGGPDTPGSGGFGGKAFSSTFSVKSFFHLERDLSELFISGVFLTLVCNLF